MLRAGLILGIAVWLAGHVSAQDTKPAATEISLLRVAPTAPRASNSELRAMEGSYTVELKVVEGKGLFGAVLDNTSPNADFPRGFERRSLDRANAEETSPVTSRPQALYVGLSDAAKPTSIGLSPTKVQRNPTDVWDQPQDDPRLRTMEAPTMTMRAKQSGFMGVENPQSFAYLEPLGHDDFHLKRTDVKKLGMKFTIEPRPVENDLESVEVSLEIETTTLDGREAVEGLDLDAGKPIIATRSLKTTAKLKLGVTRVVAIPSGPATQAALLLRVKRFELPKKD